jgi:hypothetical protein
MNALVNQLTQVMWGKWFHGGHYTTASVPAKSSVTTKPQPQNSYTYEPRYEHHLQHIWHFYKKIDDLWSNLKYPVIPNSTLLHFPHQS